MRNRIVTISDSETVTVPSETKMSICEIADLFDIYYQTAKRLIRTIEKSGIAGGDYSQSCICEGTKVHPEYYGLEMVMAVAFRVQSRNAEVFRKWIIQRVERTDFSQTILLQMQNTIWN